jgi:hypothetical protein
MRTVGKPDITQLDHWGDAFLHGIRSRGRPPPPPSEVTMGSLCVQAYNEAAQDHHWCEGIDLVDERRW